MCGLNGLPSTADAIKVDFINYLPFTLHVHVNCFIGWQSIFDMAQKVTLGSVNHENRHMRK